jgi:PadR family transcriptional regulator, regulatory protein PadR
MKNDDTPLGAWEEQVMLAVARSGEAAYGMAVRRELEAATGREVAIGAVYATLDRAEAKQWVTSARLEVEGASRRVFALTPRGAHALAETRAQRERLWRGVDLRPLLA